MTLQNKTALITAAAQGIGRASAEALARAGARVIATDLNEGKLAELQGITGIETRKLDVLDAKSVAAVVAAIGPVDVLFNCAGFVHNGSLLDSTEDELDFAYDLIADWTFRGLEQPALLCMTDALGHWLLSQRDRDLCPIGVLRRLRTPAAFARFVQEERAAGRMKRGSKST